MTASKRERVGRRRAEAMHGRASASDAPDFLAGGGETGALHARARLVELTPLGDLRGLAAGLKTLVAVMLGSQQPMLIVWGPGAHDALQRRLCRHVRRRATRRRSAGRSTSCGTTSGTRSSRSWRAPMRARRSTWTTSPSSCTATATGGDAFCLRLHAGSRRDGARSRACSAPAQETTGQVLAERRNIAERERLQQLFEQAPGFMAMLRGPGARLRARQPGLHAAHRSPRRDRQAGPRRRSPRSRGKGFFELLDEVYANGEAFRGNALQGRPAAHARRARRGALRRSRLSAGQGRGRPGHGHLRRGLRRRRSACRPRRRCARARRSPGACWKASTDCIKVLSARGHASSS